ncbi:MAG TPA: DUF222 domain-containing protein [Gammaproteobacteria bacterium]|nr:DUF222 domain-containing protein [Gammaproteobacteria bacterium]
MTTDSTAGAAARHASIDDLDRAIGTLAARINAATYDLLVLIRRFDERAGWLGWGFESCAEWLHYRCDISRSAAREKVRVAHALKTLPAIGRAFAEGRLSYSKVRALTRVAGRHNEEELLAFASTTTAARVEERCRELRYGSPDSTGDALRAHARRTLSLRHDPHRGTVIITVELPVEAGELVDQALDRALEAAIPSREGPEQAGESWSAQRADALVALAKAYLGGGGQEGGSGTPPHYQVTVHVEEAALRGSAGRSGVPIETVRRLACDGDLVVLVEDRHGEPLSVGRKTRVVPAAIHRALWARDGGCRFPGCGRKRFVEAHHIEHWATGGETSFANLILLCSAHHTLLHEGGFRIEKDYRDRWYFRRPDGRAVPACGYRPEDITDDGVVAAEEYFDGNASAEAPTRFGPVAELYDGPSLSELGRAAHVPENPSTRC